MKDVKAIIASLKTGGHDDLTLPEICLMVDKADSTYYRVGMTSPITDAEYDTLKLLLKDLDPANQRLTRVGAPYDPSEISSKVKHSIPMGSLDNTDDGILGFDPWVEWIKNKLRETFTDTTFGNITIFASLKVDGGSICATYKKGVLTKVATRGNGEYGEDITANGANFQGLPTVLPMPIDIEVRGEAILYKKDFDKVCEGIPEADRSNPRNVGNGILGRHDGKDSQYIRFLAFNLYVGNEAPIAYGTEEEKFVALKELGFTPVPFKVCKTSAEFHSFYASVVDGRDKLPFEIDGIVVVVNNLAYHSPFITSDPKSLMRPKFARAVKFPHKSNVTTLEGVEVTVGHTRAIIPTAKLKTVRVGGVNVDSALLNNYDEIARLDVAIGDEVEVVLAGDIIPKIERVVKRKEGRTAIIEPKTCPSCQAATTRTLRGKSGAVTYCTNVRCAAAVFAKLDHWIGSSKKGVGILDIGDTMIKALWKQGLLADPADLYTLTVDGIKDIVLEKGGKIGQSRAKKIIDNITAKKRLPLHTFLGSLGIDLLGRRRVELLRDAAGGQLDTLDDWLDLNKLRTIQIAGLGDTTRASIVAGMEENTPLIQKMLANGVTIGDPLPAAVEAGAEATPSLEGKPFAGLSFCFTGTRSNLDDVVRLGGTIKSGVSKGLSILVQLDATSQSNKTIKAEEYGTLVISLDYLQKAIAGMVDLKRDVDEAQIKLKTAA